MQKVERCFCCVPIRPAINIIGFWMCLTLLGQTKHFQPVLFVFNVAALGTFLFMVQQDTAKHREYFFYVFMSYMISIYVFMVWKAYTKSTDTEGVKQIC